MFGNTQGSDVSQSRRGAARALLAGGFTTAVVAGSIFATTGTSNASGWNSVAACESGGNATTNTGNGYYGLYQFDQQTWQSLGHSGTADQYSAAQQTAAAEQLYAQRGSSPWPVCGQGLSGSASSSGRSSSHRSYRGGVLGAWLIAEKRSEVRAIQQKLDGKGYGLAVDGQFGPKTEGAVEHFQAKAGLSVDGLYGARTKAALFG